MHRSIAEDWDGAVTNLLGITALIYKATSLWKCKLSPIPTMIKTSWGWKGDTLQGKPRCSARPWKECDQQQSPKCIKWVFKQMTENQQVILLLSLPLRLCYLPRSNPNVDKRHEYKELHTPSLRQPRLPSLSPSVYMLCACMLSHFSRVRLYDPMDCSPPGSSVHGILQPRILEWVAMPSSRGSFQSRDWTCVSYVSCIGKWVFYH